MLSDFVCHRLAWSGGAATAARCANDPLLGSKHPNPDGHHRWQHDSLHPDGERTQPRSIAHAENSARHISNACLLSKSFTVYALDYPGHGFSDIPRTDYDPNLFVETVEGFLDKLDLKEVTLAGISIGGVIPLLIAAKQNPRVKKVIAINPYDYARGMGIARANGWAWLTLNLARVPVFGETVMRLRNRS